MRRWAGPSEQAVAILQQIATAQGAFAEALRLGSPPGAGGTALEREAADSTGDGPRRGGGRRDGQPRTRSQLRRADRQTRPRRPSSRRSPLTPAVDPPPSRPPGALPLQPPALTSKPAAPCTSWRQPASWPAPTSPSAEGRESVSAEAIAVLTARNDAANGQADAAVAVLREHRDAYPPAAELLIEVLELAGRADEALEECDRAITRFGDGTFAHDKLNILVRAGRQEEAEAYATSLLASPSALTTRAADPPAPGADPAPLRCQGFCGSRAHVPRRRGRVPR